MLAILTTHPIQYQVPLWRALAKDGRVPFEVWYLTDHAVRQSLDPEFAATFAWDIDLLEGYPHRFLNVASGARPGSFWKCRFSESLSDRLRKSGATALWIQGWQVAAFWQAVREAKAVGIEVWLRGESNDLAPTYWWKRQLKRHLLGWLFARVDRFLYIGSANKRLYQQFGVSDGRLFSAPYAVDNERFAEQAMQLRSRRQEIRRAWNIADDAFCILFCGKFISKKRPMDLIAAATQINKQSPPTHLLFAGSGPLANELRRACQVVYDVTQDTDCTTQAAHNPMVPKDHPTASFVGFLNQTQVSKAYVAADCLVLPSDHGETWGLVVNEAMASGLPCVVSDACGCCEDLIRAVDERYTFQCQNTSSLAHAIGYAQDIHNANVNWQAEIAASSYDATIETIAQLAMPSKGQPRIITSACRS